MADCTGQLFLFPACKSRKIQVDFQGGQITSDGGSLLLRQVDRRTNLTRQVTRQLADPRVKGRCRHRYLQMVRQRVYGLALGYEDLNDHDPLRHDPLLQTAVESDRVLASSPTLCRLQNRAEREMAVAINLVMVEQFIASSKQLPNWICSAIEPVATSGGPTNSGSCFPR